MTVVRYNVVLFLRGELLLDPSEQLLRIQFPQVAYMIQPWVVRCIGVERTHHDKSLKSENTVLKVLKREGVEAELDDKSPVFDPSQGVVVAL